MLREIQREHAIAYLRTLLIQGSRSSQRRAKAVTWEKAIPKQRWIQDLQRRLPFGKTLVAIAKNTPDRYGPCSPAVSPTTHKPG